MMPTGLVGRMSWSELGWVIASLVCMSLRAARGGVAISSGFERIASRPFWALVMTVELSRDLSPTAPIRSYQPRRRGLCRAADLRPLGGATRFRADPAAFASLTARGLGFS